MVLDILYYSSKKVLFVTTNNTIPLDKISALSLFVFYKFNKMSEKYRLRCMQLPLQIYRRTNVFKMYQARSAGANISISIYPLTRPDVLCNKRASLTVQPSLFTTTSFTFFFSFANTISNLAFAKKTPSDELFSF